MRQGQTATSLSSSSALASTAASAAAKQQMEADRKEEEDLIRKTADETGMVEQEDVEDDINDMQFEAYESSFTQGKNHPDILVQAASLASVPLPPLTYKLDLPANVLKKGLLSVCIFLQINSKIAIIIIDNII